MTLEVQDRGFLDALSYRGPRVRTLVGLAAPGDVILACEPSGYAIRASNFRYAALTVDARLDVSRRRSGWRAVGSLSRRSSSEWDCERFVAPGEVLEQELVCGRDVLDEHV